MEKFPSKNKVIIWSFSFLAVLIIFGIGCDPPEGTGDGPDLEEVLTSYNCNDNGGVLNFNCPSMPNTNLSAQPDFDRFAWNSFAALNWPALGDTLHRGIPDLNKSFRTAKHDDLTVWETLKEKREIFNVSQTSTSLPPWNNTPIYNGGGLRPGTDTSITFQTLSGSSIPPNMVYNTLDETIEVKGEALEGDSSSNPIYGAVVSPRVWRGQPSEGNPVLYEVKVNYDFYDYIKRNQFYIQQKATNAANATMPGIRLPFRTSGSKLGSNNTNQIDNYSAVSALDTIVMANKAPTTSQTPPKVGAVHLKAAWIQLKASDDTTKFHTTTAEYYQTVNGTIQKLYATFGLVGLHIIQRVHTPNKRGGTFIFATWEHRADTTGFTYSNYRSVLGLGSPVGFGWFPHTPNSPTKPGGLGGGPTYLEPEGLTVSRKYPILKNTRIANIEAWDSMPTNSVWRNYQLIGTQFQAVESMAEADSSNTNYNDPKQIGQPQYLANLVIETSVGLQHFQGQPPLTNTVDKFSGNGVVSNNDNSFVRGNKNLSFESSAYNMGGCMGCHGVAQSEGYSFSFVLLDGFDGATTDTRSLFDLPPPSLSGRTPN